jgi:hypothetical protein
VTVENKTPAIDRPGDATYTPTKLEWAALELQADSGQTSWTSESPVMITFFPLGDGKTVLCLLQYTPEVPAATVKIDRDSMQQVFDIYAGSRWLVVAPPSISGKNPITPLAVGSSREFRLRRVQIKFTLFYARHAAHGDSIPRILSRMGVSVFPSL